MNFQSQLLQLIPGFYPSCFTANVVYTLEPFYRGKQLSTQIPIMIISIYIVYL